MQGSAPVVRALDNLNLRKSLDDLITLEALGTALKLAGILVLGLIVVRVAVAVTRRFSRKTLSPRTSELLVKFVRYTGFFLVAVNLANAAGLDLSALLGAAGIAGIAIGFAAQTSISNLISGIFLLTEKAYAVGDVLDVGGGTVGVVDSIDMLSVKLKTFEQGVSPSGDLEDAYPACDGPDVDRRLRRLLAGQCGLLTYSHDEDGNMVF